MAYTRYADNGDGSYTFYDDDAGTSTLATGPGARTRAMDIDALAALGPEPTPELAAPPPMSLEAPVAMPRPEPMPSLGERGALAQAKPVILPDVEISGTPAPGSDASLSMAARQLNATGAPVNAALQGGPAGKPVAGGSFGVPGLTAEGLLGKTPDVPPPPEPPKTPEEKIAGALGIAPPAAAPGKPAPAQGATAIVRTGVTPQAEAAKPPAKQELGIAGTSTSTGSSTTRALGPTKATQDALFKAQAELGAAQANVEQRKSEAQLAQAQYLQTMAQAEEKARMDQAIVEEETQRRLAPINEAIDTARKQYQSMSVDPNRWWNSRTTEQRNSATIALLLGAVGASLTKGPNVAMEEIDRQVKADIDAQLSNIDKKRGELTELQRVAQTVRQQGGDIQMQKNAMLATARAAYALRIDGMAKVMAAGYGPNQLDARGNPLPGTPAATAMAAAAAMREESLKTKAKIEADQRGTVTSETKKVTEQRPLEPGQTPDWLANAAFVSDEDRDGNVRAYAIQNKEGVDAKKITQENALLLAAIREARRAREKLKTLSGRTWNKDAAMVALESVSGAKSVALGQGTQTAPEMKQFDAKFNSSTSWATALDTLDAYENFLYDKKDGNLKQGFAKPVLMDVAEAAMQRGQAKPKKKD
jgi:hypothetical protein